MQLSYAVLLAKTCEQTLRCKIGAVPFLKQNSVVVFLSLGLLFQWFCYDSHALVAFYPPVSSLKSEGLVAFVYTKNGLCFPL